MRGAVFKQLFPHYYTSKFIAGESEVDFVLGESGLVITVDALFFKNPAYTKFLGISKEDQVYLRTHGIEKYKILKNAVDPAVEQERYREQQEAKQEQIAREHQEEIAEEIAQEKIQAELKKWQPRLWSGRGTVPHQFKLIEKPVDVFNFPVYVSESLKFPSGFHKFPNIEWKGKHVHEDKFDVNKDPYYCSIGAAYLISYKCGFSREHFQSEGIAGSLAKYAVYFLMSRFLTYPNTLILADEEISELQKNIPTKKIWDSDKFVHTREIPALWLSEQKNKANIRNVRADYYADGSGQMGIYYDEVKKIIPNNEKEDWLQFVREQSDGFTKLGQKLLQQSIESFCYAILGAQAKTRWAITSSDGIDDAKASQTQDVFRQLVQDTIVETDSTKAISNMRVAIQDTNVVLDFVVSPNVSLLPSNMILARKIPGFNNVLTEATNKMKFGKNANVNVFESHKTEKPSPKPSSSPKTEKPSSSPKTEKRPKPSSSKPSPEIVEHPESNTLSYVIVGVVISLITKLITLEIF